jgi:ATP-dependent helicase/nuclease subunit A
MARRSRAVSAFRCHGAAASAQNAAARPDRSVWVSANAGSGKTRVLTNRVARLLLAGAAPPRILCLTYTKAAAAEMRNRLFDTLGRWAMADDATLHSTLEGLLSEDEPPLTAQQRANARRLFACALETPGGLKIQTIHSFCERILRRFPLEAGISPHFEVVDDDALKAVLAKARDATILSAQSDDGIRDALATIFEHTDSPEMADTLLLNALKRRHDLNRWDKTGDAFAAWLGIREMRTKHALLQSWSARLNVENWRRITEFIGHMRKPGKTDLLLAETFTKALRSPDDATLFAMLSRVLLTKDGRPHSKRKLTKSVYAQLPSAQLEISALQEELATLADQLKSITAYRRSMALAIFAKAVIDRVEAAKFEQALLFYDDLIDRSVDLLTRNEAREWVRYKLDGGIEHILVDEAQDTAPAQWRVIMALAEDFFAGDGARSADQTPQTIFAVGDEKQSIYSFQGARPEQLAHIGKSMAANAKRLGRPFLMRGLDTSFRSAPEILKFVDTVFEADHARQGLDRSGRPVSHIAARADAPGLVELWPLTEPEAAGDPPPWYAPLDAPSPQKPERILADKVATQIQRWIGTAYLPSEKRTMRAGDILVLVRKRGALSNGVIKRLKQLGVPVAGQDRLALNQELAVKDLLALGRFCLNPEDDLTCATLLRSPFCAVSEEELFQLAHYRVDARPLFYALQERRTETSAFGQAYDFLNDMLRRADFQRPFELFAHALGPCRGRSRLVGRLGGEAEDPIDEFMALCLSFEAQNTPNLETFVAWAEARETDIKRESEAGRDEVRVMTTHGAKGLEAKVVIIPDLPIGSGSGKDPLVDAPISGAPPIWRSSFREQPLAISAALAAIEAKEAEEHRRLFYVALTRAADRLLLCGATRRRRTNTAKNTDENANRQHDESGWYQLAEAAMRKLGVEIEGGPFGAVWRYGDDTSAPITEGLADDVRQTDSPSSPAWLDAPAAPETAPPDIRPSLLGDDVTTDGAHGCGSWPAARAARRGKIIHKLLEMPSERADLVLRREGGDFSDNALAEMKAEAAYVRAMPEAEWIFGANARAEIPFTALVPDLGPGEIHGVIDRIIVENGAVTLIDFKSGPPPQEVPEAYLRQLAVYAKVAALLFPDHAVRTALIWTATPRIEHIYESQLTEAFKRMTRKLDQDRTDLHE